MSKIEITASFQIPANGRTSPDGSCPFHVEVETHEVGMSPNDARCNLFNQNLGVAVGTVKRPCLIHYEKEKATDEQTETFME